MSAETLIQKLTDTDDQSNLCVILRPGEEGLEVMLVADEKGRWSIPGGHAKDNETRIDACKREVKEETGLEVEPEPLLLADHVARKIPVSLFYATVEPGTEARPGGGDVTKTMWTHLTDLGSLNGTDRLAIQVAANRVHNLQGVVEESVEALEGLGFAVAIVAAPPEPVPGIHLRINGKASASFAHRLSEWATSLNWPCTVIESKPYDSTNDALERAARNRRLTPVLDALLHVSDALWRYESAIAPALAQGHIVIEIGPEIDHQRLLEHGLEHDLWNDLNLRIPRPTTLFTVGEDFDLMEFQCLKDAIEDMKTPNEDDARRYWELYNAPMTSTSWAEMDAIKAKFGGQIPPRAKKPVANVTVSSKRKWIKGWVTGNAIIRELVNTFEVPAEEALRLVDTTPMVDVALDNFKENNVDELKQARADDALEEFWQQAAGELAQDIYGMWKRATERQAPPG